MLPDLVEMSNCSTALSVELPCCMPLNLASLLPGLLTDNPLLLVAGDKSLLALP